MCEIKQFFANYLTKFLMDWKLIMLLILVGLLNFILSCLISIQGRELRLFDFLKKNLMLACINPIHTK